jgi:hypothetical protein
MSRVKFGTAVDWLALIVSIAAFGIGGLSLLVTWTNNRDVEKRLNTQEERQFAVYVDLGEVPTDVSDSEAFSRDLRQWQEGDVWLAVINPSPVAIRDVWVEGPDDQFIRIFEIQRCTLYVLHPPNVDEPLEEFEPSFVYFKDPRASWRLSRDGKLDKNYKDLGERWNTEAYNDNGDADDVPMENCV